MEELKDLDPKILSKIKVKNQKKILQLTGTKFSPPKAFELLKKDTGDFTEWNDESEQAADLFQKLLKREGIELALKPPEDDEEELRMREQERLRLIKLLQLKLKLKRAA